MNAKINALACQMSISSSLPIDHAISAVASRAQRWNAHPPTRCAAAEITHTIAMLISATPDGGRRAGWQQMRERSDQPVVERTGVVHVLADAQRRRCPRSEERVVLGEDVTGPDEEQRVVPDGEPVAAQRPQHSGQERHDDDRGGEDSDALRRFVHRRRIGHGPFLDRRLGDLGTGLVRVVDRIVDRVGAGHLAVPRSDGRPWSNRANSDKNAISAARNTTATNAVATIEYPQRVARADAGRDARPAAPRAHRPRALRAPSPGRRCARRRATACGRRGPSATAHSSGRCRRNACRGRTAPWRSDGAVRAGSTSSTGRRWGARSSP